MLEILCKKDSVWRKMAFQICKDHNTADDLVQEMYIKFSNYNKELNDFYIFFALRDLFITSKSKRYTKNKFTFVEITEFIEIESEYNIDLDEQKELILKEIEKLPYFERELLKCTQTISQRELARQTSIPFETINKTIKKTKQELWQKIINQKELAM